VLESISDYAVSKASATQYCFKEALSHKLPIYTIRPFAVYGDFELGTRLIPSIITSALRNMTVELSWPQYVRDFIYVQDVIDIYLRLAMQKPDGFYIFNAGTGKQSTIQDVFNTVQKILGTQLLVKWGAKEPRVSEPKNWLANIEIADAVLAWQPSYNIEQGLTQSINWFKNNLNFYPVKDQHATNQQTNHATHSIASH
jgi:nucleoside-diphosphate-sugar epimerase